MKSKKRIALVANTTWNIHNFRLNVINELIKRSYDVLVYAPVDEYISYKKKTPEVTHVALNHLKRDSINPYYDLKFMLELFIKYRRHRPDLILHYTSKPNIFGAVPAKTLGIPSMAAVTGLGYPFLHSYLIKSITKLLYRLTSRFHKKFIFENIDDRLLFEDSGLITNDKGVSIKGCGVDTDYFQPINNSIAKDKTVFTFLGRLLYDKGIGEYVEAAKLVKKQYPNTEFRIIGDIDASNPASVNNDLLNQWINDKNIVYLGNIRDVRSYIADSHSIVLPSYREAIARSLTEAMAMQKPIITTDTAGCREAVVDDKNGYLVPVKNTRKLAETMIDFHLLSDEKREEMGKEGRKLAVEIFNDKIIAKQIVDLIESSLG